MRLEVTKIALLISPFLSFGALARKLPEDTKNIEILSDLLESAQNVLEIGGGHGEVIQEILDMRTIQPKISVIEDSESNLKILRQKFGCNVRIFPENILTANLGKDFDFALWTSGIEDIDVEEQLTALRNINAQLAWSGILAIDMYANISTQQQLIQLAKLSGFAFQVPRYYTTETGTARVIYLLKKSCI